MVIPTSPVATTTCAGEATCFEDKENRSDFANLTIDRLVTGDKPGPPVDAGHTDDALQKIRQGKRTLEAEADLWASEKMKRQQLGPQEQSRELRHRQQQQQQNQQPDEQKIQWQQQQQQLQLKLQQQLHAKLQQQPRHEQRRHHHTGLQHQQPQQQAVQQLRPSSDQPGDQATTPLQPNFVRNSREDFFSSSQQQQQQQQHTEREERRHRRSSTSSNNSTELNSDVSRHARHQHHHHRHHRSSSAGSNSSRSSDCSSSSSSSNSILNSSSSSLSSSFDSRSASIAGLVPTAGEEDAALDGKPPSSSRAAAALQAARMHEAKRKHRALRKQFAQVQTELQEAKDCVKKTLDENNHLRQQLQQAVLNQPGGPSPPLTVAEQLTLVMSASGLRCSPLGKDCWVLTKAGCEFVQQLKHEVAAQHREELKQLHAERDGLQQRTVALQACLSAQLKYFQAYSRIAQQIPAVMQLGDAGARMGLS